LFRPLFPGAENDNGNTEKGMSAYCLVKDLADFDSKIVCSGELESNIYKKVSLCSISGAVVLAALCSSSLVSSLQPDCLSLSLLLSLVSILGNKC
jgi:hypothetical protein